VRQEIREFALLRLDAAERLEVSELLLIGE
jgi:hypothetical protein